MVEVVNFKPGCHGHGYDYQVSISKWVNYIPKSAIIFYYVNIQIDFKFTTSRTVAYMYLYKEVSISKWANYPSNKSFLLI